MDNTNDNYGLGDAPFADFGLIPAINGDNAVFALDVGTRTVVGVVGVRKGRWFRVDAAEVYEHKNRVVFAGQIHDIDGVASAVSAVRGRLEQKLGFTLDSAYIAAAGRALKTVCTEARRELSPDREIDEALLQSMEIEAMQSAQKAVAKDSSSRRDAFDFVGHAVTGMTLDGYAMSNLIGHCGAHVKVEYLATYLPHSVIESLFTVMRRAEVSVSGLTLEPIAALDAAIPLENRRLNLAIADIGAGTSDIAITKGGNVFAYAMDSFAGDNITEHICDSFLVDFKNGELIKYALYDRKPDIPYTDIFGRGRTVSFGDAYSAASGVIKELADKIAATIVEANQGPPAAVIAVGGGCRLPDFETFLARALGISEDRVVTHGRNAIANLICDLDILTGPECVTPFGIALCAMDPAALDEDRDLAITGMGYGGGLFPDHMSVRLNKRLVRLANISNRTVSDALVAAAFKPSRLIGKSGKSLSFVLNGKPKTIHGEPGLSARIAVNGAEAGLGTAIAHGDRILVKDAEDGADARAHISDLAPQAQVGTVVFEGIQYYITPHATLNGAECAMSAEVREGDRVELITQTTVGMFADENAGGLYGDSFAVNGSPAGREHVLSPGDEITVAVAGDEITVAATGDEITVGGTAAPQGGGSPGEAVSLPAANGGPEADYPELPSAINNGSEADNPAQQPAANGGPMTGDPFLQLTINGEPTEIYKTPDGPLLVDALNYVQIGHTGAAGRLVLRVNDSPANLTDTIAQGDRVVIKWEAEPT